MKSGFEKYACSELDGSITGIWIINEDKDLGKRLVDLDVKEGDVVIIRRARK